MLIAALYSPVESWRLIAARRPLRSRTEENLLLRRIACSRERFMVAAESTPCVRDYAQTMR